MKLEASELAGWLRAAFPVRGGNAQMDYVSCSLEDDEHRIILRLIVFEEQSIRDIKEQEIRLMTTQEAAPKERVHAMIEAWTQVLADALRDASESIHTLMPYDLAPGDAIRLARSRTREDFDKALRAKGRLGKHLKS